MDDDPFAQLLRSHRRLEERLAELEGAADRLARGEDAEARRVIAEVLGWLGRAIKRHEEDEERSLFPRLAGDATLAPLIARLTDEHRAQDALAAQLAAGGPAVAVAETARRLARSYAAHVALEETALFPACRARLSPADLAAIAAEMSARREGDGGGGRGRGRAT